MEQPTMNYNFALDAEGPQSSEVSFLDYSHLESTPVQGRTRRLLDMCFSDIGRTDLHRLIFVGLDGIVHFDIEADMYLDEELPYLRLLEKGLPTLRHPIGRDDIAIIERAMSMTFAHQNRDYHCSGCEGNFNRFGVSHEGKTRSE